MLTITVTTEMYTQSPVSYHFTTTRVMMTKQNRNATCR